MSGIILKNISNFICRGIDLEVKDGELMVLLGPTGAGKTTLLNIIAGLVGYEGSVMYDGTPIDGLPANQRKTGYLFQDLFLFPHLTVRANVAYGLKVRNATEEEIRTRSAELLKMMGIEHIADRYPKNLSGGEKQRVALARMLAPAPEILLLDEPFNNLDYMTAEYMRGEFLRLQKTLGLTTIYVTHDQDEAREVADRIAVLCQGTLEQVGKPEEIFFNPVNERVEDFIGKPNILECRRSRVINEGLVQADCGEITVVIPCCKKGVGRIAVLPKHIGVSRKESSGADINQFKGSITSIKRLGAVTRFDVRIKELVLLAELPSDLFENMNLKTGEEIFVTLPLKWIMVG